jgi:hypothetical protein
MKNFSSAIAAVAMASFLAVSSSMPTDAAPRRFAGSSIFDGLWSVSIVTLRGDCSAYRYPLRIVRGRVLKADDDPNYQVAGVVRPNGVIFVVVSGGGQSARGSGRLSRTAGAGRWRTGSGECSGQWSADRRG